MDEKKTVALSEETTDANNNENNAIYTVELKRPVEYNGKTYTALSFDFEGLTGADAMNIDEELTSISKPALVPALSAEYLKRMAVKACSEPIGADIFATMALADYEKIKTRARSFLLNAD